MLKALFLEPPNGEIVMPTPATRVTVPAPFKALATRPTGMSPASWAWDIRNPNSILNTSTKTNIKAKRTAMITARKSCKNQQAWAWSPANPNRITK